MSAPIPADLRKPFLNAISDYGMLEPGDQVLVAVSGGKDSFALLHLLGRLQEECFPEVTFTATKIRTDIT